jgi:hypothetical protein
MGNSFSAGSPADATIRALASSPRLPVARQRRLSRLVEKSRESRLSTKENAELESMLDEIDRKSFWMLARVLVQKRTAKRQTATK